MTDGTHHRAFASQRERRGNNSSVGSWNAPPLRTAVRRYCPNLRLFQEGREDLSKKATTVRMFCFRKQRRRAASGGASPLPTPNRILLLLLLLLNRRTLKGVDAFSIPQQHNSRSRAAVATTTSLSAKKVSKKKASASRQRSGASGFGAATPDNSLGGNSKKLRSVSSQHAGAGSKPLRQAALAFDRIRKAHGVQACRDVYVRSPLHSPTTFWFVGKVAFEQQEQQPEETIDGGVAACLSQKRLILEYSQQQLRPQNMGGKYASALELWLAPGDSEMDVVQNKVSLAAVRGSAADLPDDFTVDTVGYNPEIYVGDELTKGGLRVERSEEGHPVKPVFEVNQSA